MTYATNNQMETVICTSGITDGTCPHKSRFGQRYVDRDGDEWVRLDCLTVRRIHDGNIGGWFNGKGLALLTDNEI